MEASNFGTPSRCIIILLHAVHDCPDGRTAAIARHVSFAQITCIMMLTTIFLLLGDNRCIKYSELFFRWQHRSWRTFGMSDRF